MSKVMEFKAFYVEPKWWGNYCGPFAREYIMFSYFSTHKHASRVLMIVFVANPAITFSIPRHMPKICTWIIITRKYTWVPWWGGFP